MSLQVYRSKNEIRNLIAQLSLTVEFKEHTCVNAPSSSTVNDIFATPLETPLSQQEDRLATSLVRRKLALGAEEGIVQFKTGGQVIRIIIIV